MVKWDQLASPVLRWPLRIMNTVFIGGIYPNLPSRLFLALQISDVTIFRAFCKDFCLFSYLLEALDLSWLCFFSSFENHSPQREWISVSVSGAKLLTASITTRAVCLKSTSIFFPIIPILRSSRSKCSEHFHPEFVSDCWHFFRYWCFVSSGYLYYIFSKVCTKTACCRCS